jgi:hypothetical protein
MKPSADLEISLHRHDAESYLVEFRFSQPDSDADIRLGQGEPALVRLDLKALQDLIYDPLAYGKKLTEYFFADSQVRSAFEQARASAQSLDAPVRLRLLFGPSAPELNNLWWETLLDPKDGSPLYTDENLVFSRYLSSLDWRPVRLRPKGDLRALVMIANPSDLGENMAPIKAADELRRAQKNLGPIPVSSLPASLPPGAGTPRATLTNLIECLRATDKGGFDILYLVCHGALIKEEPWLWLENDEGKVARTSGTELVIRLKELTSRPRMVVLASCESAGNTAGDALSALGPRLAQAGIPAVIAMQGKITMDTVEQFMPAFFTELQRDGQIDRAMAVARGVVRTRPDYWMPVLYTRLKTGRIWYIPGFGDERAGFEKWPALQRSFKRSQVTPILGPGLFEPIFGSLREIAQRWAETYHYPMAPHERESLPQVTQFLAVNQYHEFPREELEEYLLQDISNHYRAELAPELFQGKPSLDKLINAVGAHRRARDPLEPSRILAQLPIPIYITTNLDNMLGGALVEAGKDPQVLLCPWNEYIEQTETIFDREPEYYPTPERPLVYHLFGRLDEPDSVVLTEDDYFDFLIGVTGNQDLIPPVVRRALSDSSLLFLGYQMDDWNFRVLFRSILSKQGGGRRDRYAHIAAQIDPEEGRILSPDRARRYLENYFSKGADISLFWGSAQDFLSELFRRWKESS